MLFICSSIDHEKERRRERELKRRKIVLVLPLVLALAVSLVMVLPVMAQVTFTGNVETDFPSGPGGWTCVDPPDIPPVFVPLHPTTNTSSGWDIKDVRLIYNSATDILYVGLNSYETVGDADTDGHEDSETYLATGIDVPNLGPGESVRVYFDLNQDGNWDVIAGVPSDLDYSGFTVRTALGTTAAQASFGTGDLSAHLGTRYWVPAIAPDLEFRIVNFDDLPNQGGELGEFTMGAYMGSGPDVEIEEDVVICSVNLTTPPPVGGFAFPVNKLGLLEPWVVLLACSGAVTLLMLRRRRQA